MNEVRSILPASPLRIPVGDAAAAGAFSACRPRAASLSAGTTDTTLWLTVRSLRRSAGAALSSSAPVQPPLRLEPYPAGWLLTV